MVLYFVTGGLCLGWFWGRRGPRGGPKGRCAAHKPEPEPENLNLNLKPKPKPTSISTSSSAPGAPFSTELQCWTPLSPLNYNVGSTKKWSVLLNIVIRGEGGQKWWSKSKISMLWPKIRPNFYNSSYGRVQNHVGGHFGHFFNGCFFGGNALIAEDGGCWLHWWGFFCADSFWIPFELLLKSFWILSLFILKKAVFSDTQASSRCLLAVFSRCSRVLSLWNP